MLGRIEVFGLFANDDQAVDVPELAAGAGEDLASNAVEEPAAEDELATDPLAERLDGVRIQPQVVEPRLRQVIGQILEELGNRDRYFVASKTPIGGDFSNPQAVVDTSFQRLRTDQLDLVMIHNLGGTDELMPALRQAKEAGRIRYVGVSTSSDNQYPGVMDAMRRYPLDFLQVEKI